MFSRRIRWTCRVSLPSCVHDPHGRQVLYGDLDEIRKAHSENAVVVRSNATYSRLPFHGPDTKVTNGRGTQILLKDNSEPRHVLAWLVETGAEVESFECAKTPLEDIFIKLVQKE